MNMFKYPNVVGWSENLAPKIVNGKVTDTWAIPIFVEKKVPEDELTKSAVIPKYIDDIPTDVIEVGRIEALILMPENRTKRDMIRPLVAGISIGNYAITAGTLGWFFKKNGEIFLGSNAHVFCENPTAEKQREKRIVQPGKYDGGNLNNVVGELYWYKRIIMENNVSNCPVAKIWSGIYNTLAKIFGAKTRLKPIVDEVNKIDFAVAKPTVAFEPTAFDFEPNGMFLGLGFAGSDKISLVCKASNIAKYGYYPVNAEIVEPAVGMTVEKSGRTSCHTKGKILYTDVTAKVWYDNGFAIFNDVFMTDKLLEPGDSGSGVWKVEEGD